MSATLEGARTAHELGARAFVQKPCDIERVRELVRGIGCVRRQRDDHRGPRYSLPDAAARG